MAEPTVALADPAIDALAALRKRLLNLTANNRLLHYPHGRDGNLRIVGTIPDALYRRLLAEEELRFRPVPAPTRDELIARGDLLFDPVTETERGTQPSAAVWAEFKGLPKDYEAPDGAFVLPDRPDDNRIQTLHYPEELETRLRGLRGRAETAIEETGANICYVTFGFLEWFDDAANGNARHAPLVMVPVRINQGRLNRATGTYEYTIAYTGEDILPNFSLKAKLENDYRLKLPDLDDNISAEHYLAEVERLVEHQHPRWAVRRWITISLLSFSKLLMYRDLDPDNWPPDKAITAHPHVRRLLASDAPQGDPQADSWLPEHSIDDLPQVHEHYPLIEDADSSQHSAIVDVLNGDDLVIEGPPGTGKSQTITNLIAAALARGKRVLFVAEKLAALEVVKTRLDKAGLGAFCLELHGHKTQKRRVLDDIAERLQLNGSFQDAATLDAEIRRYEGLKEHLRTHAQRVNTLWRQTGFTIHRILTAATRYRAALGFDPSQLHPEELDGDRLTPELQQLAQQAVRVLADVQTTIRAQLAPDATLTEHPWYGVGNRELMPFDHARVCSALAAWQMPLESMRQEMAALASVLDETDDSPLWQTDRSTSLIRDLRALPPLEGDELPEALALLRGDALVLLAEQLERLAEIRKLEQVLTERLSADWRGPSEVPKQLGSAAEWFRKVGVSGDLHLPALAAIHSRLEKLLKLVQEIAPPMMETARRLPPQAAAALRPTPVGIAEFRRILELLGQLRTGLLKYRGDWCEDDELDDLLPALERQLSKLANAKAALAKRFALEQLPTPDILVALRRTLSRPGLFRWFNREWRGARRALLDLARSQEHRPRLQPLLAALDPLCRYAEAKARLEQNPRYRSAFGPHFAGLETPVADLHELRAWYRAVRQHYGVGFGPRVVVGDALIATDPFTFRAIQSLAGQGLDTQIDLLLEHVDALRVAFPNAGDALSGQAPLVEPGGTVGLFRAKLEIHLTNCQTYLRDGNATLDEVAALVARIDAHDALVRDWTDCAIDPAWFGGVVDLQVPPGQVTQEAFNTATHTLKLAHVVDGLDAAWLRDAIRRQPSAALFANLALSVERLDSTAATAADHRDAFGRLATATMDDWCQPAGANLVALLARNQRALDHPLWLANWLDHLRARDDLGKLGFDRLAKAIEAGRIRCEDAEAGLLLAVFDLLAREILTSEPTLATFSGSRQHSLQEQFRECDQRLKGLQRQRLAVRIAGNPIDQGHAGARAADWTGLRLLERVCGQQRPRITLRGLIDSAGVALAGLKPCFMMGPMSVAQYLKPGGIEFDLIVMDEASQLRPEDALGAVARGKQLVVVGDPKQLPPTNFFQSIIDGDGDGNGDGLVVATAESILDAALPLFPKRSLCWHYRSRHESLIAFSNHHFYKNLVVFPSPNAKTPDYGVQLTRIQGGRFNDQRNTVEAAAVAEAVRTHLCINGAPSIGVVAMNAKQREQIERAVESLAKDDALFADLLESNRGAAEPLFIKNLENVQGDERDVILISCTYGPQTTGGPVFQRFGPINQETGWRRLNVLFTRAKQRMHLFASLGADDILVSVQSNKSVRAFRDFLAFAETGHLHQAEPTGRPPDSDFEVAVAAQFAQAGFECVPQVGVAGFFIDIAVRDPGCPGRYLMGIECDGATYHSAKSVRDRDRLRQSILEGLGWRIRRIWSTDWYRNPQAEINPIIAELNRLRTMAPVVLNAEMPASAPQSAAAPAPEVSTAAVVAVPTPPRAAPNPRRSKRTVASAEPPRQQSLALEEPPGGYAAAPVAVADLRERLLQFDRETIRAALPDTPQERRLLRPAMIDALLAHRPVDKSEFLELIPPYLRQSITPAEGNWLADVLRIIEVSEAGLGGK